MIAIVIVIVVVIVIVIVVVIVIVIVVVIVIGWERGQGGDRSRIKPFSLSLSPPSKNATKR